MEKKKTSKSVAGKKAPGEKAKFPKRIFAQASPKSIGGVSMFDAMGGININTVMNFQSERSYIDKATNLLSEAGFDILQVTPFTINIAGTRAIFESAFSTELITQERPVIKPGAIEDLATFIECPKTDIPGYIAASGTAFENFLEGVAIEEPRYYMAPSAFPPIKNLSYWHLRVPSGVSLAANADKAHRAGITGKGVKVAMVDSGHYKHPFFAKRGYRVSPVVLGPGAANPLTDESGHGTGESANIFSLAPDVELLPVKMSFTNSVGAFNLAVGLQPDIITCSWGSSRPNSLSASDQTLAAAVAAAWASGIVVIFSAGNGHWGFPGQHPDVISAGGVFMAEDESLRASDYASGFMSNIYPGRRVPDLSGLVGMKPHAIYIMLPLEPGDEIDSGNGGAPFPGGDETKKNDGWAAFSGTSAAAPQLAGAAALVKQTCSRLSPAEIRDILMKSARDVTQGTSNTVCDGGHNATVGPDLATGNGLVDAYKATTLAKIRCLGPVIGRGIGPRGPEPRGPEPRGPIPRGPEPRGPEPRGPEPRGPEPRGPIPRGPEPITPVTPVPGKPLSYAEYESLLQGGYLTLEDVQALEDIVIRSESDFD